MKCLKKSFNYFSNLSRESFSFFSVDSFIWGRPPFGVSKKRESTPDVGFDLIFCVNKSEKSFHGIFPVGRFCEKRMSNNQTALIPARLPKCVDEKRFLALTEKITFL